MGYRLRVLSGAFAFSAMALSPVDAAIPRTLALQGVLTSAARVPLADGTYPSVTFRLYDHLTGPAQLWIETKPVVVAGGHGAFATALGSVTAIPDPLALGEPCWLSVQVGADAEMSPRLPLGAAPYALSLSLPFAGTTASLTPGIAVTNSGLGVGIAGSGASGVVGVSTSQTGAGVSGQSAAGTGAVGVFGGSAQGTGVHGHGEGTGVRGDSVNGIGVVGSADGTGLNAAYAVGVFGSSANGTAVDGNSLYGTGVHGSTLSGYGVLGSATTASAFAIYGRNDAQGPSVGAYYKPGVNGVGLFAGDSGWFGSAAIETNLAVPGAQIFCAENGTGVFYVAAGGAVHALSYGNLSDARYKKDIRTVDDPLATVEKLRGVSFEWNPSVGRSFPKGRQIGFVAQEVRRVLPELVSEDEKGYLSVEYANVVPVLVEAIKQQQTRIVAAGLANARLEVRLQHLEQQVRSMSMSTPHRARH